MTDKEREALIISLVSDQYDSDDVEVDGDGVVSEGEDNGAFVRAWVWVSFANTPLDKDAEEDAPADAQK